jgi:competence protein ComFC
VPSRDGRASLKRKSRAGDSPDRAGGAARLLLDILFPGRCLLCGAWLAVPADHPSPVCGCCRGRLLPIAGERCGRCGVPLVSEHGTCVRCRGTEYAFESNLPVFAHAGAARDLLARLKFEGRKRLAPLFADLLETTMDGARRELPIVPVPSRPGREGADAVEVLARCLERRHGRQALRLLARRGGVQQKTLDFARRRENLSGMIVMRRQADVPAAVLLLDDVFTTGATLDACAAVLRQAGCRTVLAVTLTIEL